MIEHFELLAEQNFTGLETLDICSPFDQNLIATSDIAHAELVESALSTAFAHYRDRSLWLSKSRRIEILQKTADLMQAQFDHLSIEAAREGGKPLVDSRIEVSRAIDGIRNSADCLRYNKGQEIPMGVNAASENHLAMTSHEPIGVVVAVSAFNHPLNLIVHQIGPAIAAGCPVIVKPAQDTPLSCLRLVKILREAGLPKEWCQALVITNRDLATQLVSDERVGFLSFIGSAKVGWILRSKLTPGARCALEHGGVAPVILEADADLPSTVPGITRAGFYHAGQVCVSVQRLFVHQSIVDEVLKTMTNLAESYKVGDPTLEKTDIGPLIRPAETQRIHQWVQEAITEGATLLAGGEIISDSCYQPTILLNPAKESKVSKQEVFGPVICVYSYENIDDAIAQANSLPFAFQAAVYTKNIDTALKCYKHMDASAVMVNDHTAFRVDWMPFAGLKHSGLGVGGIPYTFHDMQVEKMLVMKSPEI